MIAVIFWIIVGSICIFQPRFSNAGESQGNHVSPPAHVTDLNSYFSQYSDLRKMVKRSELIHEARRLAVKGSHEEAIAKYQEALNPNLIDKERDKTHALWGIMRVHQQQGKYELALKEMEWFLKIAPSKEEYIHKKMELEALIKSRDISSQQSIYDFIEFLNNKYRMILPPHDLSPYSLGILSTEIQLYDLIGDHDAGIALVESFRKKASKRPKIQQEYLRLRQAFEEDKIKGTKGRATQVLMQSDYFTW
jgi:tetratricopeptide (TPR) repeat protein